MNRSRHLVLAVSILMLMLACPPPGDPDGGRADSALEDVPAVEDSLASLDDVATLTEAHANLAITAVVRTRFDRPLSSAIPLLPPPLGDGQQALAAGNTWFRLYQGTSLRPVAATVYLDVDARALTLVPDVALEVGTRYLAVVASDLPADDGTTLGRDLRFEVTVREAAAAPLIEIWPALPVAGQALHLDVNHELPTASVHWRVGEGADARLSDQTTFELILDATGQYPVEAELEDGYGRHFSTRTDLPLYPDLDALLALNPAIRDVHTASLPELADQELASAISTVAGEACALRQARHGGSSDGVDLVALQVPADWSQALQGRYLDNLMRRGRLLGLARFRGMPAILSRVDGAAQETLRVVLDSGGMSLHRQRADWNLHVDEAALSPTPLLFALDLPVSEGSLDALEQALSHRPGRHLQRLEVSDDGTLSLFTVTRKDLVTGQTKGFMQVVGAVTGAVVDVLGSVFDFLTADAIALLRSISTLVTLVVDDGPWSQVADARDRLVSVRARLQALRSTFGDNLNRLNSQTDPQALVDDVRSFLYNHAEANLKDLARLAFDTLNQVQDRQGINPFEQISDILLAHGDDAASFLNTVLVGLDVQKTASATFSVGNSTAFELRYGNASQSLSLDLLEGIRDGADWASDLSGVPLDRLVVTLSTLASQVQGRMGFSWDPDAQSFVQSNALTVGGVEVTRMTTTLSSDAALFDCVLRNPLAPGTELELIFDMHGPAEPDDPDALRLLYVLASPLNAFPALSLVLRTVFRDLPIEVTADLRPEVSFGASMSVGEEANYAVVIGGKQALGMSVDVSIPSTGAAELVYDALSLAVDGARSLFSSTVQYDGSTLEFSFPDEQTLMAFSLAIFDSLRSNVDLASYGIEAGLGASFQVGAGVGAGGTATGGAAANAYDKIAVCMSSDLTILSDYLALLQNKGASSFYFGDLARQIPPILWAGDQPQFDVKRAVALFRSSFDTLLAVMSSDELDALLGLFARHVSFALSVETGIEGEIEAGADLEVNLGFAGSVSVNGEFVLNTLLAGAKLATDAAGLDGAAQYDLLKAFDQPGVYPEIRFSLPVTGGIAVGADVGLELSIGASVTATFLSGSFSIPSDPYRQSEGAVSGSMGLSGLPAVALSVGGGAIGTNEDVVLTAHTALSPNTTLGSTRWDVDGQTVATNGNTLTQRFSRAGGHLVQIEIADSLGRQARHQLALAVQAVNHAPTAPVVVLASGAVLHDGESFVFTPGDDIDGDSMSHEVQFSAGPDFSTYMTAGSVVDEIQQQVTVGALPYRLLNVRMRAFDGQQYSAWSATRSFTLLPAAPVNLEPADGFSYTSASTIELRCTQPRAQGFQFELATSDDFTTPLATGSPSQGVWQPGPLARSSYSWRVRVQGAGAWSDWSATRHFVVVNSPPASVALTQALPGQVYTDGQVEFHVHADDVDGDTLTYTLDIWDAIGQQVASPAGAGPAFTLAAVDLGPGVFTLANAVASDGQATSTPWSALDRRSFTVSNTPPYAPLLLQPVDGTVYFTRPASVTLTASASTDFDDDPISSYIFFVVYPGDEVRTIPSTTPGVTLDDLTDERWTYTWWVRALAASGSNPGQPSAERSFVVYALHEPFIETLAPEDGAVFEHGNPVALQATAVDPDGDGIAHIRFQVGGDASMTSILGGQSTASDTFIFAPPWAGIFFWHAQPQDTTGQDGAFSTLRCFSSLDGLEAPALTLASSYEQTLGSIALDSVLHPVTLNCLGQDFGLFAYEVAGDPQFDDIVDAGALFPGAVTSLSLGTGLYFIRARHSYLGLDSAWSAGQLLSVVDNDPDPSTNEPISFSYVQPKESDASVTVTLQLDRLLDTALSVQVSTADNSARAGEDYQALTTTVVIPAHTLTADVVIPLLQDNAEEGEESFVLIAEYSVDSTLYRHGVYVTIRDDDGLPWLRVEDGTGREADASVFVQVRLTTASDQIVSVQWHTVDDTALAGQHYVASSGTATLQAQQLTTAVEIPLIDNGDTAADTRFRVVLSSPVEAHIERGAATVTIQDDESRVTSKLSVADRSVNESSGSLGFLLTLDRVCASPVTVHVTTVDGSAEAGTDYTAVDRDEVIAAGQLSTTVTVTIVDDAVAEQDESFSLLLSNAVHADILRGAALGTIEDDDTPPELSIDDLTVDEHLGPAILTVHLNKTWRDDVQVTCVSANATAFAPADYTAISSLATIPAGQQTTTCSVPIVNDTLSESSETFSVTLQSPQNATISSTRGSAVVTIRDNDALPVISLTGAEGTEGMDPVLFFNVALDHASDSDITVQVRTVDGSAQAPDDFVALTTPLLIPANTTTATAQVTLVDDATAETDESFELELYSPSGATLATTPLLASATVHDNDQLTVTGLAANPTIIDEPRGVGPTESLVTATLSASAVQQVTITLGFSGTAQRYTDYDASASSIVIDVGQTQGSVTVSAYDECVYYEAAETIIVTATGATGAQLSGSPSATITLQDNYLMDCP
ncbi:MAG: Calx-beta domain-containing protein [Pseudomonadota bacterium]